MTTSTVATIYDLIYALLLEIETIRGRLYGSDYATCESIRSVYEELIDSEKEEDK